MCYNPITIKMPDNTYRQVPCGHCLECLSKQQNEWCNRMTEELKSVDGKAVFFTLTYSDDNVPKNYIYDYNIYRSPSDYAYKSPTRRGVHKKESVDPCVELIELGVDTSRVIDFNIHRDNHDKFIEQIQKIYGDYIRLFNGNCDCVSHLCSRSSLSGGSEFDFDTYNGDFFGSDVCLDDLNEDIGENVEAIASIIKDNDYPKYSADSVLPRERPVMSFNSVRKKDVQDWIKRGRQRLARLAKKTGTPEKKFTFWVTAEYGPRTLRPHYHGILFGVTADEVRFMAKDWQNHFGERIQWEDVNMSKGGCSYVTKYCSKGFFEHPLCSKDFFYRMNGKDKYGNAKISEYHSKHYERCVEIFGIDEPIVDRPFKLVSKGMGLSYVTEERKQRYTSEISDMIRNGFNYEVAPTVQVSYTPVEKQEFFSTRIRYYDPSEGEVVYKDSDILLRDLDIFIDKDNSKVLHHEEKHRQKSEVYGEAIKRLFDRFHYARYNPCTKATYLYGMPKYYREKILGNALRIALASYVQEVNVELYREKFEQIRAENPLREDSEIVLELEARERKEKSDRYADCRRKVNKYLNKSQI